MTSLQKRILSLLFILSLVASVTVAQDTVLTVHVYPKYVGGPLTTVTGLEQPLAFYIEYAGLKANTAYEQQHIGLLTRGTSTVRGSKWANNTWISPSTRASFVTTDANGKFKRWVFVRSPSSYVVGVDTALLRVRVNEVGASATVTRDAGYMTSLHVSDTAKGATAGAIVYGYLDSLVQTYVGRFIFAYQNPTDVRPLAGWLVYKRPKNAVDSSLYNTRLDTLLIKAGYFQLVVPANVRIGKLEIRDSSNNVVEARTSTSWTAGQSGSKTELNYRQGTLVSIPSGGSEIPTSFELSQNYPNPFNPETKIEFALPQMSYVNLTVTNLLGQHVSTLVNQLLPSGVKTVVWRGTDDGGRMMPSGVYFYRIQSRDLQQVRRMVLVR